MRDRAIDIHKLATQYLTDQILYKDDHIDLAMLEICLYRAYSAGQEVGYKDGKNNAWWKEQEKNDKEIYIEEPFDEDFFGSDKYGSDS